MKGLQMRSILITIIAVLPAAGVAIPASAADAPPIVVREAWLRATVPGQQATAAFMRIAASADTTLAGAATPIAKIAEIHTMSQDAGIMKMRAVDRLPIRGGTTLAMTPDGIHLMLMSLARPIRDGEVVPITLTFVDSAGRSRKIDVEAKARPLTATDSSAGQRP